MLATVVMTAAVTMATPDSDARVREAIALAMRDRFGAAAIVTIDALTIDRDIDATRLQALPDPDSKLGRAIRFTLRSSGERRVATGSATARVHVSVPHAHPARPVDRGDELTPADLVEVTHEISGGALRALPSLTVAAHSRVLKPIAPDACVTASAIAALPAVRGGREVAAVVRIDGVEARTVVTASQNGDAGDVIRVVNRQSRRALKARVLSPDLVEIIHD